MSTASGAHKSRAGAFVIALALWASLLAAGGQAAPVPAADDAARTDACAPLHRRFDAAFGRSAEKPPLARLRALHRAALRVGEDPAGCVRDRIIVIERAARAELVRLVANDEPVAAGRIVQCGKLEANLRCSGWAADDAAGLGDLSAPAPLAGNARLRLALWPGYRPRRVRAFTRAAGAQDAQPLGILRGGKLDLHDRRDGDLIVIVEDGVARPLTKYVWALKFSHPN